MGQHRWWLKLFFYLLDVGTANALVLFRATTNGKNDKMSIVDFKRRLVQTFIGHKLGKPSGHVTEHVAVRSEGRHNCAYCALFSQTKRTRFRCECCKVPLCCVGTGFGMQDCFRLTHENEAITTAVRKKYEAMQMKTKKAT